MRVYHHTSERVLGALFVVSVNTHTEFDIFHWLLMSKQEDTQCQVSQMVCLDRYRRNAHIIMKHLESPLWLTDIPQCHLKSFVVLRIGI